MKKYLIIILYILPGILFAQLVENRIQQIDLKLDYDKAYLNAKFIVFTAQEMPGIKDMEIPRIKRKPFTFNGGPSYSYRILFLDEGVGIDSVYILRLEELKQTQGVDSNVVGNLELNSVDTTTALFFRDIYSLKLHNYKAYKKIVNGIKDFILLNGPESVQRTLKIKLDDKDVTVLGVADRKNEDFLNFERPLTGHWMPKQETVSLKNVFSRRAASGSDFRFKLSLSSFSFSYRPIMDFGENSGSSIEINTEEPMLNHLPYFSNTINAFARIVVGTDNKNILNSSYFIAKVGYRFAYDNSKIMDIINYINIEKPKLNFTNAFFFELKITRPFDLPYFTLKASLGQKELDRIKLYVPPDSNGFYYYTRNNVQGYFSFYWNASDKKRHRFRIDAGIGYHNIFKTDKIDQERVFYLFQPIIGLNYIYFYTGKPLAGLGVRFYDQTFKTNLWVNLASWGNNQFRGEILYLSEPIARDRKPWEVKKGAFINLSWRYGLN